MVDYIYDMWCNVKNVKLKLIYENCEEKYF